MHFARSAKMVVLSWIGGAAVPEDGVDVTVAPVLEEELILGDGVVDVTLVPVLGGVVVVVDVTLVPVLEEEFRFGDVCASTCSKK
jgi:hypothetical protein